MMSIRVCPKDPSCYLDTCGLHDHTRFEDSEIPDANAVFIFAELDGAANDAGVPAQDDQFLNEAADSKVNSDIPFGNN